MSRFIYLVGDEMNARVHAFNHVYVTHIPTLCVCGGEGESGDGETRLVRWALFPSWKKVSKINK